MEYASYFFLKIWFIRAELQELKVEPFPFYSTPLYKYNNNGGNHE